ncbi:unnamed protein product [Rotaria magnacalcarata]|uniref:G-protein coupled receptors family 1 profile domain-containing protein n=2 Tax=Rotaria magnacalcarata TaxID=392030 RepID=A0A814Z071_9BILA|nr:unnamed protein product [Rotaria magnacalcarata]CAF1649877.1 unnamed protein product [Rotaria magnacalcarata]CAF5037899.1 unnamed protein product [Rotaria magnacalcarata]CAF5155712.1 unnamed protein product [Rotaria magnacalcarata]
MSSTATLNYISQQLNIYLGISMFIFGLIGCLWNMLIFRHYSIRLSSCCVYMLISALASLIQLIFGLLIRIISEGFQLDWTLSNIAWCKIRNYITFCASSISLSCNVWATIDRFLSTCHQIKWRSFNSVYIAKGVCLLTTIIWMLAGIPNLIYIQPMQTRRTCASSSFVWSTVSTYVFNLLGYGICPWLFMSIFGLLTLKNVRRNRSQRINPIPATFLTRMARIDNQLTSVLLFQIIVTIISSMPYCIQRIYDSLTEKVIKTEYRRAQEYLFLQIVRLLFYFNYISMFYLSYLSSSIFRNLSKKVLVNLFKNKHDISREITIINHQNNEKQIRQRQQLNIATIQTLRTSTLV